MWISGIEGNSLKKYTQHNITYDSKNEEMQKMR